VIHYSLFEAAKVKESFEFGRYFCKSDGFFSQKHYFCKVKKRLS